MIRRNALGAVLGVGLVLHSLPVLGQSACAQLGVDCSHPNVGSHPSGGGGGSYGANINGSFGEQNYFTLPFWAIAHIFGGGSQSSSPSPANSLNDQGIAAYNSGNWSSAASLFKQSLQLNPNSQVVRKNLAYAQANAGQDAYKKGDYAAALSYFQQAAANVPAGDPGNQVINEDLAAAQSRIEDAKRAEEQRQQDKIAAASMQQSIQRLGQSMSAAPTSGGLEFGDGTSGNSKVAKNDEGDGGLGFMDSSDQLKDALSDSSSSDVTTGTFGDKVVNHHMKTLPKPKAGSNTNAGDQLKSAANGGDLTHNYDIGDAKSAGSLAKPNDFERYQSFNPATFTDKERKAPGMSDALKRLSDAQAERSHMEDERDKTIAERNRATSDPKKFAELNEKVDQETQAYQDKLHAVQSAEGEVTRIRKHVDTTQASASEASNTTKQ